VAGIGHVDDLEGEVGVVADVGEEPVGDDRAEAAVAVAADDDGHGQRSGSGVHAGSLVPQPFLRSSRPIPEVGLPGHPFTRAACALRVLLRDGAAVPL
jgi:hypothetical protein